jgi:hypothetical protein
MFCSFHLIEDRIHSVICGGEIVELVCERPEADQELPGVFVSRDVNLSAFDKFHVDGKVFWIGIMGVRVMAEINRLEGFSFGKTVFCLLDGFSEECGLTEEQGSIEGEELVANPNIERAFAIHPVTHVSGHIWKVGGPHDHLLQTFGRRCTVRHVVGFEAVSEIGVCACVDL